MADNLIQPTKVKLIQRTEKTLKELRDYLNDLSPRPHLPLIEEFKQAWRLIRSHPVRTKNLEKVAAHLEIILQYLVTGPVTDTGVLACLVVHLDQLEKLKKISFNNAWELSDTLENIVLHLADNNYINAVWSKWPSDRIPKSLKKSVNINNTEDQNSEAIRAFLIEDQRQLAQEYRRDRAKITLRQKYLLIMAGILLGLDVLFCLGLGGMLQPLPSAAQELTNSSSAVLPTATAQTSGAAPNSTTEPDPASTLTTQLPISATLNPNQDQSNADQGQQEEGQATTQPGVSLFLVMLAGAVGSVLSRAYRLSRQSLGLKGEEPDSEPALGIRSLLSAWTVFLAQPVIGATAALFVYLVLLSPLVSLPALQNLEPVTFIVFAFVTGYAEPFFLNIIGRVQETVGTP